MKESAYFVLTSNEDGIHIKAVSDIRAWLKERLNPEEYSQPPQFIDRLPALDHGYFFGVDESATLIIRGEIVVPKPKKVVTEYEVE